MIKLEVFDVGHGGCHVITCPNGARIMLDCGYGADPYWFPSASFGGLDLNLLALMNLDEDHVGDLPYLLPSARVHALLTNPTVTAPALARMKLRGGMGRGVAAAHLVLTRFGTGLIGDVGDLGGVRGWYYYNRYGLDFTDTNNLSLLVFLRYGNFTVLFAGDLEQDGWLRLLDRYPGLRYDLSKVDVFVAAHHGRRNGCCDEVFRYCRPRVFLVSDDEIRYASQETQAYYRKRAHGVPDYRFASDAHFGYRRRFVLTTRRDGTLTTFAWPDGSFWITPEHGPSRPEQGLYLNALGVPEHA
jgi:beta-lactamase superfamily II metal-dependent hydrolase